MRVFGYVPVSPSMLALGALALLSGCGDDVKPTQDASADTVTADADTSPGESVSLTLHLVDFLTQGELEGLSVSFLDQSGTTDAAGTVTLSAPRDTDLTITATGADTRDHLFYHRTGTDDEALTYPLGTDGTITAFEGILGLTVASTKGILEIITVDAATGDPIPDLTITADVSSDLTLVFDAESATGLSAGNTTLEGAPSTAIFVNIDAGAVTPAFAHLWGWTCAGPPALEVPAGSYVIAEYACAYTPVPQSMKLTDFLSGTAVAGATVNVLDQTLTSDAAGVVVYDAPPNADVALTITGGGFRDHYIYRRTLDHEAVVDYPLATDATISGLEAALGVTVDDAKAIVEVSIRQRGTDSPIPGVTVDLDAAYGLALVYDASAQGGLNAATTTLADSLSSVIFVNADAGDVTPSFSDSAGNLCDVGPPTFAAPAGSHVLAEYECAVPSN